MNADMPHAKHKKFQAQNLQGFTLIELLVTIAILAILLTIAVPSFTSFIINAELRGTVSTLQTDAMNARAEAVKLAKTVVVKPTTTSAGWVGGWQTVVQDSAGVDTKTLTVRDAASSWLTAGTGNGSSAPLDGIRYNSAGFATTVAGAFLAGCVRFNAVATLKSSGIVLDAAGRPRVWKGATTDTNCSS
jgi:type IV fimbrial biogenesis protein FimT